MSSLPGRRRSWPGAAHLAAVAEDWHAEQRAESGRRVHVGSRALALLATAGILACLIVLSSGSILGGGKAGSLRRQRLEGGRRMAAEVPFAQQHTIAAGILVEPAQQRQLVPNLLAGSSEDEEEAAGSLAAAELELAGQQEPGGSQGADEEADPDEEEEEGEEEEGEEEEEEEDNLDEHAMVEAAAAAEQAEAAAEAAAAALEAAAAASDGAASGDKRSGVSKTASGAAAEGEEVEEEDGELLTRDDFGLRAKRWQAKAAGAALRGGGQANQPSKRQAASDGGSAAGMAAAGATKLAAAEQLAQQDVGEGTAGDDEGAAEGGSSSKHGGPGGVREAGAGRKAGPAETAQPADPAEEGEQRQQQRQREAAARAGQVSLTAGAAELAEPLAARVEPCAARAEPAGGAAAAEAAAVSSAPKQGSGGERKQPAQEQASAAPKSAYHLSLERCNDLACLREAAQQERHPGQFLFPHALVIGFHKSAAAGLFAQLAQHPGVLTPQEQESEFFSKGCDYDPAGCSREDQQEYIQHMLRLPRALRGGLRKPVVEGSTRYAAEGLRMAKGLHEVFPWIKLVASLREPISRAVAVLASARDEASQRCLSEGALFACLKQQLPALNYTAQLDAWLEAFPADQVMLLQYETLASPDQERVAGQLSALHKFLGLEPTAAPSAGGSLQLKESPPGTRSLRIKTEEYQALVKLVRPDAKSIADIVAQRGFGDGKQWLKGWEKVWQATLNTCTLEGNCTIRLV